MEFVNHDMNLLDRLFLQAEIKVNNIRLYILPKLSDEMERIKRYADDIEAQVKRARLGEEEAVIQLIKHAFPSKNRG